jgi:cobalamin-dependent methionine synthase I
MPIEPIPEKPTPSRQLRNPALLLVGEGLHVLNPQIHAAIKEQNSSVLTNMVQKEVAAGAQALSINLGPGREIAGLTPWVVDTIADATEVPLFLSTGVFKMNRLLEKHQSRITINAITADPAILTDHLTCAKKYKIDLVVLLVKPGLVPSGIEDRIQLAFEVVDQAMNIGLPLDQLYLDPVFSCRPDPIVWEISRGLPDIGPILETIGLIKDLNKSIKTIVALGNGTLGMSQAERAGFHRRILPLLVEAGLEAVMLNCFDNTLIKTAQHLQSMTTGKAKRAVNQ